jgi:DNA modification methylase
MIFYEEKNVCLYHGDSINILKKLENNSVDVVFADPPYNMQLDKKLYRPDQTEVDGVGESQWDIFASFKDYDEFSLQWLTQIQRILKDDGTFWVIGSYHNLFRLGKIIQDLGFWVLNDIIWAKSNPMPNFKGTRFTNSHETLLWCSKSKNSKYYFHYHSMKILNDDKQMTSIWEFPICSGSERIKSSYNKTAHPTQKPLALLNRILLASTKEGDVILDPFLGTGTTGVVCKKLGRKFVGIEKEEEYLQISKDRIQNIDAIDIKNIQIKVKLNKRVSLGILIEQGLIDINEILFDKAEKHQVNLKVDGSIELHGIQGSIHQVAKEVTGKITNGWDFWYIKNNNNLISIDKIRQEYFSKNNI